jgi:EmrB/QacA subfamily drug resistance transporter
MATTSDRTAVGQPAVTAAPMTPAAARPGMILALVSGAQFMFILDLAIVNLAVPSIERDLALDPSQPQWVVVTYGLTLGGFLLLGGRVADLFGRRNALVGGLAVFTAASLAAGLARAFVPLVAARAVQGLGAAFAAPAALSTLTTTFPEGHARNRALAIFGAVGASAASIGLVLGGALTSGPGWEWVFLMNVPVGLVLAGFSLVHIPPDQPQDRGSADLSGAVLVTAGLLALVYAINRSAEHHWTSMGTVGFGVLGAGLLVVFAVVERRVGAPILPLSIFQHRTLTAANVLTGLVFGSFIGFNLQLTLYMQQVLGYSAIRCGLAWLATSLSAVLVGVRAAARAVDRIGAAATLMAGQLTAVVGLAFMLRVPVDATYPLDLLPGLVLIGIAIGFSGMAVQVAGFTGIPAEIAGVAGGVLESCREIGGALGTAVIATVVLAGTHAPTGAPPHAAEFTTGLHHGALVSIVLSATAALVAATALRRASRRPASSP